MTMPTDTPSSSLDPPNFVRSNSSVQLSRSSSDLNDKMINMPFVIAFQMIGMKCLSDACHCPVFHNSLSYG